MLRLASFLLATFWLAAPAAAQSSEAGCRCKVSTEEIEATNRWLWLNERDREAALAEHLPWGAHLGSAGEGTAERLLVQRHFVLRHDGDLRLPLWASYKLTAADLQSGPERLECFRRDPRLPAAEASVCYDYGDTVYRWGQLVPDLDMRRTRRAALHTYLMSNIVPQYCRFSRGPWLLLEELARSWAATKRELWITSGVVMDRDGTPGRDPDGTAERMRGWNGAGHVAVPSGFYKVIVTSTPSGWHSLAFLLPHDNEALPEGREAQAQYLRERIVPLAEIERVASLDLHPALPSERLQETAREEGLWSVFGPWPREFSQTCRD